MECKDITEVNEPGTDERINRNIVECKGNRRYNECAGNTVLIETLWNVKADTEPEEDATSGINRNIVECKAVNLERNGRFKTWY